MNTSQQQQQVVSALRSIEEQKSEDICFHAQAQRETTRGVLRRKIENMEQSLKELRSLELALPMQLPREADEALWKLLINI